MTGDPGESTSTICLNKIINYPNRTRQVQKNREKKRKMDTPQANGPLGYRPISRINGSTPGMQKGGPTFSTPMAASASASSLNAFASELGFAKTSKASPRSAGPLTRIRPGSRQGQQSSDGDAATPLTVPAHAKTSTLQLPEKRARGKHTGVVPVFFSTFCLQKNEEMDGKKKTHYVDSIVYARKRH